MPVNPKAHIHNVHVGTLLKSDRWGRQSRCLAYIFVSVEPGLPPAPYGLSECLTVFNPDSLTAGD